MREAIIHYTLPTRHGLHDMNEADLEVLAITTQTVKAALQTLNESSFGHASAGLMDWPKKSDDSHPPTTIGLDVITSNRYFRKTLEQAVELCGVPDGVSFPDWKDQNMLERSYEELNAVLSMHGKVIEGNERKPNTIYRVNAIYNRHGDPILKLGDELNQIARKNGVGDEAHETYCFVRKYRYKTEGVDIRQPLTEHDFLHAYTGIKQAREQGTMSQFMEQFRLRRPPTEKGILVLQGYLHEKGLITEEDFLLKQRPKK